jgi:hypothetical protein
VLLQLRHPCLRNGDALVIGGTISYGEKDLLRICDDILYVLVPEHAQQLEEEISFRQAARQFLFSREVLRQQFVLHAVLVQVLEILWQCSTSM